MKNLLSLIAACLLLFSCKKENFSNPDTISGARSAGGSSGGSGCASCVVSDPSINISNFNGTPIEEGDYVWFNAHIKLSKIPASSDVPFTISLISSSVDFSANGSAFDLPVPDATITFSNTATTASTTWDASTGWNTTIPYSQVSNDEIFLTGFALPVPAGGLPGGINPVTWTSTFNTSIPTGVSLQWQWSAAVYNNFHADYNNANVTVLHSNYHSGSPLAYKNYVTGGARGGGGSNFTGSWSSTGTALFHL